MKIHVKYLAQLKNIRGQDQDTLELPSGATIREAIVCLIDKHATKLRDVLLTNAGDLRPSILIFTGDGQIDLASSEVLTDGQTLTLLSPMAGG